MGEMGSKGASEQGWRKGPWTPEEDKLLVEYVRQNGEGRWSCVSKCAGLNRSGKSCRLRWVNYLRPGLKKGHLTPQEEGIILELHALWGNKWSTIARYLPGRTDNEIKNYWRTHFKKRKPSDQKQQDKRKTQDIKDPEADATRNEEEGRMENPQPIPPMIQQDYSTAAAWSDFMPVDNNYLWGGLWNLEDHNGCSKMAIQNQANVGSYARGGDPVNYLQSGGYIF